MPKNAVIIIALAVIAIVSVVLLFLTGAISLGGDKGDIGKSIADLNLGEMFDEKASHVKIEPFNVAIIQNNRVLGTLYVSVDLETGGRSENVGVVQYRPRLRNAYLKALSRYANNQVDPKRPVNILLIKRILQRATDNILGEESPNVVVSAAHITKPIR